MKRSLTELLKARTEAIRQFRIAFAKHAPQNMVDELRAEIHHLQRMIDQHS